MNKRQVFFNCDYRGKLPISVAVYSLLKSAQSTEPLWIYLAHDHGFVENGGREKVQSIVDGFPFASISFFDITDVLARHPVLDGAKWPSIAWAWAFATEIFPDLHGNFIFIDWDMFVRKDLSELYNLDLERQGFVSAAVNESRREHRPLLVAAGWPESAGYSINSGTQVINADVFRREHILDKMLAWYSKHKDIAECVEQDSANVIYGNRILRLHLKYNFTVGWYDRILNHNPFDREWRVYPTKMVFEACADPAILHFIGHRKPWARNHRAFRNTYRSAMKELGLYNPKDYYFSIKSEIIGRLFDFFNLIVVAYSRLMLKTILRFR